MKQKQLKRIMEWAKKMVEQYNWLTIKYEYSEFYRTFLVSFSPLEVIDNNDDFNKDVLAFEDLMTAEFGDDAPLFTDDEKLFPVSDAATVITKNTTLFAGLDINTAFCLLPQLQLNWMGNASYNQAETIEMEIAVDDNSKAYQVAA